MLDGMTMAQLCSEAEWYVGTRGGIMDQFIALLAQRDHALFLDCRPGTDGRYHTEAVALPQGYHILVANSGVRHQNPRGDYNQRVAACRAGVALLRARYRDITHLRDVQDVPWVELAPQLPEEITVTELSNRGIALDDIPGLMPDTPLEVHARCRHVWTENRRVLEAVAAMRSGDVIGLGKLLDGAHASARDDYEISCPELEVLVGAAREVDGVAGARLTGAGWGGCIVALVHADAVPAFQAHVAERYRAETGLTPAVFDCRAGPGAGSVIEFRP
jgi:galactokinase